MDTDEPGLEDIGDTNTNIQLDADKTVHKSFVDSELADTDPDVK